MLVEQGSVDATREDVAPYSPCDRDGGPGDGKGSSLPTFTDQSFLSGANDLGLIAALIALDEEAGPGSAAEVIALRACIMFFEQVVHVPHCRHRE